MRKLWEITLFSLISILVSIIGIIFKGRDGAIFFFISFWLLVGLLKVWRKVGVEEE